MLLVNPWSDDNSVGTDMKYLLFLPNVGYLCNDNDWEDKLNHGGKLDESDFLPSGDTVHFDEPPVDLIGNASFTIRSAIKIHRKMSTFTIEEMVEA
jgi:hypothetical protein